MFNFFKTFIQPVVKAVQTIVNTVQAWIQPASGSTEPSQSQQPANMSIPQSILVATTTLEERERLRRQQAEEARWHKLARMEAEFDRDTSRKEADGDDQPLKYPTGYLSKPADAGIRWLGDKEAQKVIQIMQDMPKIVAYALSVTSSPKAAFDLLFAKGIDLPLDALLQLTVPLQVDNEVPQDECQNWLSRLHFPPTPTELLTMFRCMSRSEAISVPHPLNDDLFVVNTYNVEMKDPLYVFPGWDSDYVAYGNDQYMEINKYRAWTLNVSPTEIFQQFPTDISGRPVIILINGLTASPEDQNQAFQEIYEQYYANIPLQERPIIVGINWNAESSLFTNTDDKIDGFAYLTDRSYRQEIQDTGVRLGKALEMFQENNPYSNISIIGHSVGVEIALAAIEDSRTIFKDIVLVQGASTPAANLSSTYDELLNEERVTGSVVATYDPRDQHLSRLAILGQDSLAQYGFESTDIPTYIHNVPVGNIKNTAWEEIEGNYHGRLDLVDFNELSSLLDCLDRARITGQTRECFED